ncbi:MAG: hypothetical protein ACR2G5_09415 [Pyrinomonadaceae bacterium]
MSYQLSFTELANYSDIVQESAILRPTGEAHNEPKITKRLGSSEKNEPLAPDLARKQRALSIVEETFGAIKGLDRVNSRTTG